MSAGSDPHRDRPPRDSAVWSAHVHRLGRLPGIGHRERRAQPLVERRGGFAGVPPAPGERPCFVSGAGRDHEARRGLGVLDGPVGSRARSSSGGVAHHRRRAECVAAGVEAVDRRHPCVSRIGIGVVLLGSLTAPIRCAPRCRASPRSLSTPVKPPSREGSTATARRHLRRSPHLDRGAHGEGMHPSVARGGTTGLGSVRDHACLARLGIRHVRFPCMITRRRAAAMAHRLRVDERHHVAGVRPVSPVTPISPQLPSAVIAPAHRAAIS